MEGSTIRKPSGKRTSDQSFAGRAPASLRFYALSALVLGGIALVLGIWAFLTLSSRQVSHDAFAKVGVTYAYTTSVEPNPLYPQGGTAPANAPIFPSITTGLAVSLQPTASATTPMTVSLRTNPVLRVIAKGLWQQDTLLGKPLSTAGTVPGLHVVSSIWSINVPAISADINAVQKAILTVPSSYLVVVDPRLEGVVAQGAIHQAINWDPKLTFVLQGGTWQVQGPLSAVHQMLFQHVQQVPVYFRAFGLRMQPGVARALFGLIALLLLILGTALLQMGRPKRQPIPQWQRIEHKYRARIVRTSVHVQSLHRELVHVESFDALLRLAEEKELPILRTAGPGAVEYVVVDGDLAYSMSYARVTTDEAQTVTVAPDQMHGM